MKAREFIPAEKPRNFVAKNAKMGGAGKMKDKSKTIPRKEKHKKPVAEGQGSIVDKCASLAAKYFNSAGLQQQYDIGEYIKANVKQGVAEEYELAGVGVAYELGRRAYKQGMTIRDNPYSATREARKNDEWAKGLERGKHDANDARHFRNSVREQGVAEGLNELSNEKLAQYKKAAGDQATAADKAGDYDKGHKRFKGIVKATNKQFDNDAKERK